MVPIILASHGPFCEGLLASLEMIAGPQEKISALQLHEGESPEDYRRRLDAMLTNNETENGTLILCDLKGGTPYNSIAFASQNHKLALVTGMNIPMVVTLSTIRSNEMSLSELVDAALMTENTGIESIDLEFKGGSKHGKLSLNKNR